MIQAFETIKQLAADFKEQETAYLSPSYQESQIRQDFIDKFFTALGWDVTHTIQKNPYQQEVHIENKVHMVGSQRRADYAFFLAPNFRDPKFFVEAKKPSRNLANADDYYQTIRYGWNANTPIAILTDFEEFHILDCRFKPNIKDVMSQKIEYFHYSDYANEEKFSRIYWLFSREAVAGGSLEKRVAELPKPRGKGVQRGLFKGGYQPVDEAFLEELDKYREVLAKAFKKSNPDLQSEELTEAIQRIIDRLVFIRFLEDKQIEEPEINQLASKKSAWKGFLELCKQLDPKYNGLIFKSHKVLDGKEFVPPDDEEFAAICRELSDPHSPYNFDQIPISILGSIYERFLGKVVHATDKRVKVEEKPEVRKAGGVYYTPEYIVRYIVNETVGKLLYGETVAAIDDRGDGKHPTSTTSATKTPEQVAQMAFADIACGSGSFLIEVYNVLLDYHIRYYIEHPDNRKETDVFERDGKLHLTLKKKKEILLNNIYGVDIDFQATEVTQLSLYLKLLEDVTMHDAHQFGMFKETILPDLRKNIINGNSLIGRDIIEGELFADADENKLKPMNFEDAFPAVMKRGGFDAVVGNPPWIDIKGMDPVAVDYYFKKYATVENRMNIYAVFFQVAISLLKIDGIFGYITPSSYTTQSSYSKLRSLLLENYSFDQIVRLPDNVFKNVVAETIISILRREKHKQSDVNVVVYDTNQKIDKIDYSEAKTNHRLQQSDWKENNERVISLFVDKVGKELISKVTQRTEPLINYCEFTLGLTPYDKYKGHSKNQIDNRVFHSSRKKDKTFKPLLSGKNIRRYFVQWDKKEWISYGSWLGAPRDVKFFKSERILVRQILSGNPLRIYAGYIKEEYYNAQIAFNIILRENTTVSIKYILAILNSSLLNWYHRNKYLDQTKNIFQKILIENAKELPIRTINFEDPQDKSRHDAIVKLVEQMLDAKEKLSNAKTEAETNRLEMQCQTLDRQIDEAVYDLYGLTPEEIAIVEGK